MTRRAHAQVRALGAVLACLCSLSQGCLTRENLGTLPAPDAGPSVDAGCAGPDAAQEACRYESIEKLIYDLADGSWRGDIALNEVRIPVSYTFGLDGTYTMLADCSSVDELTCFLFFPGLTDGRLRGRYSINDVILDEYYGYFEDPVSTGTLRSEIKRLTIQGDTLTFDKMWVYLKQLDFMVVLADVQLERVR